MTLSFASATRLRSMALAQFMFIVAAGLAGIQHRDIDRRGWRLMCIVGIAAVLRGTLSPAHWQCHYRSCCFHNTLMLDIGGTWLISGQRMCCLLSMLRSTAPPCWRFVVAGLFGACREPRQSLRSRGSVLYMELLHVGWGTFDRRMGSDTGLRTIAARASADAVTTTTVQEAAAGR